MNDMPEMGAKVRMLVDTAIVKPTPLKGQIGVVTACYPGYTFKDNGETIEVPDCVIVQFDVPTGYQDYDGVDSHSLALHCDQPEQWEPIK